MAKFIHRVAFILFLLAIISCAANEGKRTVTVGIYDNPPKISMNRRGKPRGIFADTLKYIARRENWQLEYRYDEWSNLTDQLQAGNLDLLVDVAWSETREEIFDFNNISPITSWLKVYTGDKDFLIIEKSDLRGITLALLKGSSQQAYVEELNRREGLAIRLVVKDSYEKTAEAVKSGEADACLVSRFFEYSHDSKGLYPSPLVLKPTELRFAAPQSKNADLLAAIDSHLTYLLNEDRIIFSRIMITNLKMNSELFTRRLMITGIILFVLLLLLFIHIVSYQRQKIKEKSAELCEQERAMEKIHRMNLLGQLSSEISHDFNNILYGITGYVELIKAKNSDEEIDGMLDSVLEAGKRGESIIRQILYFGKSGGNQREELSLGTVVREVLHFIRAGFPSRVAIRENFPPDDPVLLLDRSRVYECLMNICANGLQAIKSSEGFLEITLTREVLTEARQGLIGSMPKGSYVKLTIRDSGCGIDPEIVEKIFDPYFTTKDGEGGTGLGLSVVRGVMEEHGGDIDIESVPGEGTAFTLYFPLAGD